MSRAAAVFWQSAPGAGTPRGAAWHEAGHLRIVARAVRRDVRARYRGRIREEPAKDASQTIGLDGLLPVDRGFLRYQGSLTTPPCSEGVLWAVLRDPIEAPPVQISQFAALFPLNARPVQSLHRRFLLESI